MTVGVVFSPPNQLDLCIFFAQFLLLFQAKTLCRKRKCSCNYILNLQVRLLYDSQGHVLSQATPSIPVEVVGWRELPSAGDEVVEVKSEVSIKYIVNYCGTSS